MTTHIARPLIGVGTPNRQWTGWTIEECALLAALKPEVIVYLDYADGALAGVHLGDWARLHDVLPGVHALVRFYQEHASSRDAAELAREQAGRAGRYGAAIDVVAANEENLEHAGADVEHPWQDWDGLCDWLAVWAQTYRQLRPADRLHLPALSPIGDYQRFWRVAKDRGLAAHFDVVDVHCYAREHLADLELAAAPGKPVWITETNQIAIGEVVAACKPSQVEAVCWFITGSPDPQFAAYSLTAHPEYVAAIAAELARPREVTVSTNDSLRGIDVSSNNGQIDWPAVAASGVQFALIKATEDDGYVNPRFAFDRQAARAAGLALGFYHYARPSTIPGDAAAEAQHFLATVGLLEPGEVLALDLEEGDGNLLPWALTWLRAVERQVGFKPLIYTAPWFSRLHGLEGSAELSQYGLWLADWGDVQPPPLPGWPFVAILQSSASGSVPGMAGAVDLDWFNGSLEQFRAYGAPAGNPWTPLFDGAWVETERLARLEHTDSAVKLQGYLSKMKALAGVP